MSEALKPDERRCDTALYRYFDDQDRLLYIGITGHLASRDSSHAWSSGWTKLAVRSSIMRYPSREEALAGEEQAIKAERPLFNVQHNDAPGARERLQAYLEDAGRLDLLSPKGPEAPMPTIKDFPGGEDGAGQEDDRATRSRLLAGHELQRVAPSREYADDLIARARKRLASADHLSQADPETAYRALCGGARLALIGVLAAQGLRATTRGGAAAIYESVRSQIDPALRTVVRPFPHMQRICDQADFPQPVAPRITSADVRADLPMASAIIDLAARVLDEMSPF